MRIVMLPVLAAVVSLSGCASRAPSVAKAPLPPPNTPIGIGDSNRFEMTQNGRRMRAEDFDAWMKARGIRIAKGADAKPPVKAKPTPAAKRR